MKWRVNPTGTERQELALHLLDLVPKRRRAVHNGGAHESRSQPTEVSANWRETVVLSRRLRLLIIVQPAQEIGERGAERYTAIDWQFGFSVQIVHNVTSKTGLPTRFDRFDPLRSMR